MTDNYAALLRQTARVYRESLAAPDADDIFSLAYQWQDKKHRHVHDLCNELEQTADRIEKLEAVTKDDAKWMAAYHKWCEMNGCAPSSSDLITARKALEGKDGG